MKFWSIPLLVFFLGSCVDRSDDIIYLSCKAKNWALQQERDKVDLNLNKDFHRDFYKGVFDKYITIDKELSIGSSVDLLSGDSFHSGPLEISNKYYSFKIGDNNSFVKYNVDKENLQLIRVTKENSRGNLLLHSFICNKTNSRRKNPNLVY